MTSSNRSAFLLGVAAALSLGLVASTHAEGSFFRKNRAPKAATAPAPKPEPQTEQVPAPQPAPQPEPQPEPEPPAPQPEPETEPAPAPRVISGNVDRVESTDTLIVAGQRVQLTGIRGEAAMTQGLVRWLTGNDNQVSCEPVGTRFLCKVPRGVDVGLIVLSNGAGRADGEAGAEYKQAEAQARAQRRGVWAQ